MAVDVCPVCAEDSSDAARIAMADACYEGCVRDCEMRYKYEKCLNWCEYYNEYFFDTQDEYEQCKKQCNEVKEQCKTKDCGKLYENCDMKCYKECYNEDEAEELEQEEWEEWVEEE